jgi:hypothetical protein
MSRFLISSVPDLASGHLSLAAADRSIPQEVLLHGIGGRQSDARRPDIFLGQDSPGIRDKVSPIHLPWPRPHCVRRSAALV